MASLNATTTMGMEAVLDETTLGGLGESLQGDLLYPGSDGYDEARALWNALHDRRPALIARCAGASDVATAVNFARAHDIPVAVRGGGHNVAGTGSCDGGLLLDLAQMKGVQVDPGHRSAHAEPGLTWGELDRATQAFGLATPGGICSDAGIAGLTLGGGF